MIAKSMDAHAMAKRTRRPRFAVEKLTIFSENVRENTNTPLTTVMNCLQRSSVTAKLYLRNSAPPSVSTGTPPFSRTHGFYRFIAVPGGETRFLECGDN